MLFYANNNISDKNNKTSVFKKGGKTKKIEVFFSMEEQTRLLKDAKLDRLQHSRGQEKKKTTIRGEDYLGGSGEIR